MLNSFQLPAPADWQAFERLTRDLFASVWRDANTQMNGRTGQPQCGVDVFGVNVATGKLEAVQCKGKDGRYGSSVTVAELKAEVQKALKFVPQPTTYYLVSTGPADVAVQKAAREISAQHVTMGLFPVHVFGWDHLLNMLQDHRTVARKHFRALHIALAEIDAKAELIAICHQSFQSGNSLFHQVDPIAAAEGFYPVLMDASAFYDAGVLDARSALATQRNLYRDVSGQLRAHPDATVAYFGIAHIPLVMHAGAAASTRQAVKLYELDYASGQWEPLSDEAGPDLGVVLEDLGGPQGASDAVVRVEVSSTVSLEDVQATFSKPYRHLVIRVKEPKRGVVKHHDQARAIADAFRQALDLVHNENPAAVHHIFAAVPVSVAFRLGQMVSFTMHRSVLAYNYSQKSAPPYHWAVDLLAADNTTQQLWTWEDTKHV